MGAKDPEGWVVVDIVDFVDAKDLVVVGRGGWHSKVQADKDDQKKDQCQTKDTPRLGGSGFGSSQQRQGTDQARQDVRLEVDAGNEAQERLAYRVHFLRVLGGEFQV